MEKILVIGRGGREHAVCAKLKKDSEHREIFIAPGNAGTAEFCTNVPIDETDNAALVEFAKKNAVDLTIVGPENALMNGIADAFEAEGLRIFAPKRNSAIIEGSKEFAKELMLRYGVPTASYRAFTDYEQALCYVRERDRYPVVVKYDGLAAGKGVVVAETYEQAQGALKDMLLDHKFHGNRVVIEEFLKGEEFSLMAFVNGTNVYPMESARDHKRAFDGDRGGNTGGMGAYSPVRYVDKAKEEWCCRHILRPVAEGLAKEGRPFTGILYAGLIDTSDGVKVIEFNARFGDPETEVVLPRLKNDLYRVMRDVLDGKDPELHFTDQAAVGVVLASKGYPEKYESGYEITYEPKWKERIYHMGTERRDGKLFTKGGRVLFAYSLGDTFEDARKNAYEIVGQIKCSNLFYRSDIGKK